MKTLNSTLLLDLISNEIARLEQLIETEKSMKKFDTYFNHEMKIERLKEQFQLLDTKKTTHKMLMHEGGEWLGTIREFIQRKFVNGETVIWGSNEILKSRGYFTVLDLEYLAASIASASINEFKK